MEPEIIVRDTPNKYILMKNEILPPLIRFLKELNAIEERMAGEEESADPENFLKRFDSYNETYGLLASAKCTNKLLKRGYAQSYGKPARYAYLNTGCRLFFTMKSDNKAVIETVFDIGIKKLHRFTLKKTDGEWKIDDIKYRFPDESARHDMTI